MTQFGTSERESMLSLKKIVQALVFIALSVQAQQTDFDLISTRRKVDLAETIGPDQIANIPNWLASQSVNGTWTDVDYTSGCDGRESKDHDISVLCVT